jgi:hypothetical protein
MQVELEFEFLLGQNWPDLVFLTPVEQMSMQIKNQSSTCKTVSYQFLTHSDQLSIRNNNKSENDTVVVNGEIVQDQIVKLQKIWIDNILLDYGLIKDSTQFVPEYSVGYLKYCESTNTVPPTVTQDATWYFNGVYTFCYSLPFWNWYAAQRHCSIIKNFSQEEIDLYFGNQQDMHGDLLAELRNLLNV